MTVCVEIQQYVQASHKIFWLQWWYKNAVKTETYQISLYRNMKVSSSVIWTHQYLSKCNRFRFGRCLHFSHLYSSSAWHKSERVDLKWFYKNNQVVPNLRNMPLRMLCWNGLKQDYFFTNYIYIYIYINLRI